jgi:DNA-binding NarL/FixJ family response regulator
VSGKLLRILIADDQALIRRAVRLLLESHEGWTVVGEASNGREAVAKTAELKPDVVVMDVSMPEKNGLDATREIHQEFPQVNVLILTLYQFPELAKTAQDMGARGCLLKSDSNRYLIPAVAGLGDQQTFARSET